MNQYTDHRYGDQQSETASRDKFSDRNSAGFVEFCNIPVVCIKVTQFGSLEQFGFAAL